MLLGNNTDEILMLTMHSLGGKCNYVSNHDRWLNHAYKNILFSTYSMRLPFDNPRLIAQIDNKLFARSILARKSAPVIPWYLVEANTDSQLKFNNIDKWVVKPIDGMKGNLVLTNISLKHVLHVLSENKGKYFFAEPFIKGQTYRVLLLNNRVIAAYRTHPPKLAGDGISTVGILLKNWVSNIADNYQNIMSHDADIENTLKYHNVEIDYIPRKGDEIQITGVVNICRGATWEHVLPNDLNKEIVDICVDASNIIGLRLVGIDIIATENDVFILETNPSPGLYGHTVKLNSKQHIESIDLSISQEVLKEAISYFSSDITFDSPKFTSISYDEYIVIRKEYINYIM